MILLSQYIDSSMYRFIAILRYDVVSQDNFIPSHVFSSFRTVLLKLASVTSLIITLFIDASKLTGCDIVSMTLLQTAR